MVLPQQPSATRRTPPRPVLRRIEQRLHERRRPEPDRQEPETQAAAQREGIVPAAGASRKRRDREVDVVGDALSRNCAKASGVEGGMTA